MAMIRLSEGLALHKYRGKTSNVYIIVDSIRQATYMVDCGIPGDVPNLTDFLKQAPPLNRVIITHFHVDHISGWIELRKIFQDAEIWFHEKARPFVMGHERIPFPSLSAFREILIPCMKEYGFIPHPGDLLRGALYGTPFRAGFPEDRVQFYNDSDEPLPGFKAIHTPGHRPDCTSFYHPESGAIITGDTILVMNGEPISNTFLENPDDQNMSIEKIMQLEGLKIIYPGHGICYRLEHEPFLMNMDIFSSMI